MSERRRKRKSRRDQLRNTALSELGSTGLELLSHGKVKIGKRMSQEDRERTQARVGLASNVLGLTAAGVATGAALKNPALRRPSKAEPGPVSGRVLRAAEKGRLGRAGRVLRSPRGRAALIAGGAGSALGLQLANLGGDVVANRVLSREAGVSKAEWNQKRGLTNAATLGALGAGIGGYSQYQLWEKEFPEAKRPKPKGMPFSEARKLMGTRVASDLKARGVLANVARSSRRLVLRAGPGAGFGAGLGIALGTASGFQKSHDICVEVGMGKAEFSFITKSDEVLVTGHGVNIAKSERFTDAEHKWYEEQANEARRLNGRVWAIEGGLGGATLGGAVGGYGGTLAGALASRRRIPPSSKLMTAGLIGGALAGAIGGGVAGAKLGRKSGDKRARRFMNDPQVKYRLLSARRENIRREKAVSYKKSADGVNVEKRNFNAEADRQRRLGLYAGAGIGGGLVAGDAARKVVLANSKKIGDLYDFKDKRIANKRVYRLPKRRLDRVGLAALAAGSVLGVGGGLAAYKRGIDERNNPWG